ncbi:F-box domain-containing protein [Mycena sanguinolenta]|uniref:F-box domain-containing protein n=1 Tax=Mycena sanguinolenta TaxID=230812 RepID=A0A8H7DCF7_9AGAR|nr:F-box domain-containing protein [Mycena sanguinolenta]
MPFDVLPEDVLLSILCLCDVYTILTVSAINKSLRHIASSKQLWLSLVQDSTFRAALDLPPPDPEELGSHSTEELIDFVKSSVIGPGPMWPRGCSSATVTDLELPLDEMGDRPAFRLLPGARYILLHSITQAKLYIYDVWNARRVWEHAAEDHTICQIDLVPGTSIARVFLAQPVPVDYSEQHTLHIEEVDFTTGLSRQTFELGFPTSSFGTAYAIVGDYFLCTMLYSLVYDAKIELIPGHIISTYLESSATYHQILAITRLDAFTTYWQPLTEACLTAQLKREPPTTPITVKTALGYDNRPLGTRSVTVHLTVTPNALRRGAYNVDVHGGEIAAPETIMGKISNFITVNRTPSPARQALLSYRFTPTLSCKGECQLRLISGQRVFSTTETSFPRTITQWSGGSIIVPYRQQEWPMRRVPKYVK